MRKISLFFISLFSFVCLSFGQPVTELKVLAIGNSFSVNAYHYLASIIKAHGKIEATLGNASIGGCSLERHWKEHQKSLADPAHKPYSYRGKKISLRDFLVAESWDVVTLQQNSLNSFKPETYFPWADHLAGLVKELAPQARLHIHQTWAYRPDHRLFRADNNFTPEEMYQQSGDAYRQMASRLQARLIPAGEAMWVAYNTQIPAANPVDPDFDYKQPIHPNLPKDSGALINGHRWRKNAKTGQMTLSFDGTHANLRGCYLIGCVWYAYIFQQKLDDLNFVPDGITPDDANFLRKVAQEVVQKQLAK